VTSRPEYDQQPLNNWKGAVQSPDEVSPNVSGGGCDGDQSERLSRLKAAIKAGTYRVDIKDIAKQLARAMESLG
jgi:anti-sigma28 factor (negative regulator of flagellin synthesis)